MVEQHWNALRSQVVKKKETDVQSARKAWSDFGSDHVASTAEPEVESDEDPMASTGMPNVPQQLSRVQLVQRQA